MNPGPVEEVGETARSAISTLGASPFMLALVLLQFGIIGALLYSSIDRQNAVSQRTTELHQLLDKCLAGHISRERP